MQGRVGEGFRLFGKTAATDGIPSQPPLPQQGEELGNQYDQPSLRYSFASTHTGPISR